MPGPELAYPSRGPDLYPATEDDHKALLGWCQQAFIAAQSAKRAREDKWKKYHRVYRSFIERDDAASWRSAVFIPYTFSVIETITPKMVAQLPSFVCDPVGPEDVVPAKLMEQELERDAEQTDLYVELIKAIKTSLKYGTGILKNYYFQDIRKAYEARPVMQPVTEQVPLTDPTSGEQMTGLDGNPQYTESQAEEPMLDEQGNPVVEWVPYEYVVYAGPKSSWVDPFHFWVAPEAADIDDARYTIERFYRTVEHVQDLIDKGVYRLPEGMTIEETFPGEDEGIALRSDVVGEDGQPHDTTRRPVELLEYHTSDNRVITVMNQKVVIRVQENPYWHGQKPYAVFPDYLQEGEFWGVGEVEAIEGLQDLGNSIVNQRIDNVTLTMNAMFAVNAKALEDERDLLIKPGGIIRLAGDFLPQEAVQRIDMGDVTSSAFEEAQEIERLIERVSSVSAYQLGTEAESQNRTATGVSLITESGNTKFGFKVTLMEKMGLRRLAQQWGAIIQQFIDEERTVRMLGPNGMWLFPSLTPDSIQGNLDYKIDVASSTQTDTVRKEQATMLFQTLAPVLPQGVPKLAQDLLEAFGVKDFTPYLMGTPDLMLYGQMMQAQQSGGVIVPFPNQPQGQGQGQGQGAEETA